MIIGLLISAAGTLLLNVASGGMSYEYVLVALFIIALGFSLQQIIANYVLVSIGEESKCAQRLILAGAMNSLGNTIAPVVLSYFIFKRESNVEISLRNIQPILYLMRRQRP